MSFGTGYNFEPDTKARATEVNQNFTWFRGHYLPITVSNTWINTSGVYDLGSSSFQWRNLFLSGSLTGTTYALGGTYSLGGNYSLGGTFSLTGNYTFAGTLTVAGSVWPYFSVFRTEAFQNSITGVDKIQWTGKDSDTNSDFDNATNYRFTPTVIGKYLFTIQISWASVASGEALRLFLYKNGSEIRKDEITAHSSGAPRNHIVSMEETNTITDYFECFAQNPNTNSSNLFGGKAETFWMGSRIA